MLFDLQGKRKRVIQVVYAFLALLLAVGLVGLGIGGDANGGIFDAIGLGDDGSGDSQFQSEVDDANATLETDPENTAALLALARNSYLVGQQSLETDEQGNSVVTEDAAADFETSIDAWERYLESNKGKPDDTVASLVLQAYSNLAFSGQQELLLASRTLERGIPTATIVAEARPSPSAWIQVATFAAFGGDDKAAEEAGKKAVEEANQADRDAVEAQLKQLEKQGAALQKQLKDAGPTEEDLEDPLGGLGVGGATGGSGTGTGTAPAP